MQQGNYKADKANGYFINYYNNGQVSDEGWYVDGKRQGTFLNYDLLGHLKSKIYFLDDKEHGVTEYFIGSGKLDYKGYYDNGWFNKIEQFDSTGKLMVSSRSNNSPGLSEKLRTDGVTDQPLGNFSRTDPLTVCGKAFRNCRRRVCDLNVDSISGRSSATLARS